jgi:hypothetical protein
MFFFKYILIFQFLSIDLKTRFCRYTGLISETNHSKSSSNTNKCSIPKTESSENSSYSSKPNIISNPFFSKIEKYINILNKVKYIIINYIYNNVSYSFLPFISLNIPIAPDNLTGFNKVLYGVLTISIILLSCFINIIGYLLTLYLIKYTDIEIKYPRLKPFITYFKNTSLITIIIEIIFFIVTILAVIGVCIKLLYFN